MKHILVDSNKTHVIVGDIVRPFSPSQNWKVMAITPPSTTLPEGLVMIALDGIASTLMPLPSLHRNGFKLIEVEESSTENGVSFGTAAHNWKFVPGDVIGRERSGITGHIVQRLYDQNDGDPRYFITWHSSTRSIGNTLELAHGIDHTYDKMN